MNNTAELRAGVAAPKPMSQREVNAALGAYVRLMEEIKQRSILIGRLAAGQVNVGTDAAFEFCQLEMRLCCEAVALGCVIAHGELSEVKAEVIQTQWNAEKIFKRLERLHASFFPQPHSKELISDTNVQGGRRHHLTLIEDGYLTKEELIKSYVSSGNYLHRGTVKKVLKRPAVEVDFAPITRWNERFGRLLAPYHLIRLLSGDYVLCVMNDEENGGAVSMAYAQPPENRAAPQ